MRFLGATAYWRGVMYQILCQARKGGTPRVVWPPLALDRDDQAGLGHLGVAQRTEDAGEPNVHAGR